MHKMCEEMISSALRNQPLIPHYAAASTLPPVITYIGANKKMVVEPPVIEPSLAPQTHRVHDYEDLANSEAESSYDVVDASSSSDYSVDYSYSSVYEGSAEYEDDLTDDENVDEDYRKTV